jgi:hypothetical protein
MPSKKNLSVSLVPDMRGHDLSGRDLTGLRARDYNFFEAIFNGCTLRSWHVAESVFQHADFAETHLIDCTFDASSFDHSDFVAAEVRDSVFRRCTFQNAEWRDVTFINVRFQQCVFRNTTTTLAKFVNCTFDRSSSSSFVGPSKRYNTYTGSTFYMSSAEIGFLRLNFGVRNHDSNDDAGGELTADPLFGAAVDYYNGSPVAGRTLAKIVTVLHSLIESSPPRSPFLLKYVINICESLIASDELSVFAMEYVHDEVHDNFNAIRDTSVLLDIVAFMTLLRLKIRERIADIATDLSAVDRSMMAPLRCHLIFAARFPEYSIREFANVSSASSRAGLAGRSDECTRAGRHSLANLAGFPPACDESAVVRPSPRNSRGLAAGHRMARASPSVDS